MYVRKKFAEEIVEEDTQIWSCPEEGCNEWMRDNFSFEAAPTCSQCHTPLVKSVKKLPVLVNTNKNQKSSEKGIQIGK
ncbi:cold-shock protein [Marinicrinis sediminis]|uniref:Cold-shock protein n=1 Tax=Marinicrinis sediminis TaxID=1652465 RepID=A0ABW5R852_9BACL